LGFVFGLRHVTAALSNVRFVANTEVILLRIPVCPERAGESKGEGSSPGFLHKMLMHRKERKGLTLLISLFQVKKEKARQPTGLLVCPEVDRKSRPKVFRLETLHNKVGGGGRSPKPACYRAN